MTEDVDAVLNYDIPPMAQTLLRDHVPTLQDDSRHCT